MSARKKLQPASSQDAPSGEFLSLLAHELRNPLAPIRHSTNLLRMLSTDQRYKQPLDVIDRQLAHLTRLVDDLVDGARLQRGLVTLRKQRIDLGEIAQHALDAVQPRIDEHRKHLIAHLPGERVQMECDAVRLRQVLDTLLDNALTYTSSGDTVELAIETQSNMLHIRVSDTGMGMSTESLPHVFNFFSTSTRGTNVGSDRLGIGLAISRSLIELHGGTIVAYSEGIGRGSTFMVTLPLTAQGADHEERVVRAPEKAMSARVLIVDDNVDAAEALATLLALEGHMVSLAHTAAQALQAVDEFEPSIVFLDIQLPDFSGYEVARRLREKAKFDKLRVVALTAYGSTTSRARAEAAGMNAYLVKPAMLDALTNEILTAMNAQGQLPNAPPLLSTSGRSAGELD